ncbi:hypothetical protein K505DRAFT_344400, partial [Melanomma pulvis-pyrius CBS 109.77]
MPLLPGGGYPREVGIDRGAKRVERGAILGWLSGRGTQSLVAVVLGTAGAICQWQRLTKEVLSSGKVECMRVWRTKGCNQQPTRRASADSSRATPRRGGDCGTDTRSRETIGAGRRTGLGCRFGIANARGCSCSGGGRKARLLTHLDGRRRLCWGLAGRADAGGAEGIGSLAGCCVESSKRVESTGWQRRRRWWVTRDAGRAVSRSWKRARMGVRRGRLCDGQDKILDVGVRSGIWRGMSGGVWAGADRTGGDGFERGAGRWTMGALSAAARARHGICSGGAQLVVGEGGQKGTAVARGLRGRGRGVGRQEAAGGPANQAAVWRRCTWRGAGAEHKRQTNDGLAGDTGERTGGGGGNAAAGSDAAAAVRQLLAGD